MIISTHGYRINKKGEKIFKPISELGNSCHKIKVLCDGDECRKEYEVTWGNRIVRIRKGNSLDLCRSCVQIGERNSSYGKDRNDIIAHARSFITNFSRNFSEETKQKMSKTRTDKIASGEITIKQNHIGKCSWYFSSKNNTSFHADSNLELMRMIQLDDDDTVVSWTKRHKIRIPYIFEGKRKYTTPDFRILTINDELIVEEIKGRITKKDLSKKKYTEKWCKDNGYIFSFLTQKEMNKNGEYRRFLKMQKISS